MVIHCGPILGTQAKLTKGQKKITGISKIHEFEFKQEGVIMRRVSQLGPGKAVKLQEIRISTRYQATVVNEDHLVGGKPRRQTTARCSGPDIPVERNALEESGDAGSDFP